MKKILVTLAVIMMAVASCSVPQTAVMDKIRQIDNIQSTRVPVSLLGSLAGLGNKANSIPGVNLSALKNVNTIDVINITESGAKNKARRLLDQFYKGNTYELIFGSRTNRNQGVSLYALPMDNNTYSDVIMINDSNAEITIVELTGAMSMSDLKFLDM